jgi:hypothetical protein
MQGERRYTKVPLSLFMRWSMRAENQLLREATDSDQPKPESRAGKYVRITIGFLGMAFILFVIVMAILNR